MRTACHKERKVRLEEKSLDGASRSGRESRAIQLLQWTQCSPQHPVDPTPVGSSSGTLWAPSVVCGVRGAPTAAQDTHGPWGRGVQPSLPGNPACGST